jgi:hypothetical protein
MTLLTEFFGRLLFHGVELQVDAVLREFLRGLGWGPPEKNQNSGPAQKK